MLSFISCSSFSCIKRKTFIYYKESRRCKKLIHERNLLQTQLEIQEQTFQDISLEIHDNIGLSLTLAKLQLNTIDYTDAYKSYR